MTTLPLVLALVVAAASAALAACVGDEASRPVAVAPVTTSLPFVSAEQDAAHALRLDTARTSAANVLDAGASRDPSLGVARPAAPAPSFGPGSVKPGDVHPFRMAVSLRGLRANASGAKLLRMLAWSHAPVDVRAKTSVDPLGAGEWLLVYGSDVTIPGQNAMVLRHSRPDAEVARAIASAGLDDSAGPRAVRAEMLGVNETLLRPQPGVLAFVPVDRAGDFALALSGRPIESGLSTGELARIFVAEPAKIMSILPPELAPATIHVIPAPDGGLDLAAEASCPAVSLCKAIASDLDTVVKRRNSLIVRMVTRGLFSGLEVRADGKTVHATLHASVGQVDAILNVVQSELGAAAPSTLQDGGLRSADGGEDTQQ